MKKWLDDLLGKTELKKTIASQREAILMLTKTMTEMLEEKEASKGLHDQDMTDDLLESWCRVRGYMKLENKQDGSFVLVPNKTRIDLEESGRFW